MPWLRSINYGCAVSVGMADMQMQTPRLWRGVRLSTPRPVR